MIRKLDDRRLDAAAAGEEDLRMSELLYADDATTFLALASKLASVSVVQRADCRSCRTWKWRPCLAHRRVSDRPTKHQDLSSIKI
jgi:hypothetical protein